MVDYEAYKDEIHDLTERVDRVLKYIEENPNSDPNAYEMMELTADIGVIQTRVRSIGAGSITNQNIEQGYEYAKQHESLTNLRNKYFKMMDIRLEQIKQDPNHLGTDENSPLYKLLSTKYNETIAYEGSVFGKDKEMSCKLAGMGLYQKQRKRDFGQPHDIYPIYNQIREIEGYYSSKKPIPEAEKEMLSELLCIFMSKDFVDNMLSDKPIPYSELRAQTTVDASAENIVQQDSDQQFTFAQKMAKKIADSKFLSKLPFMDKFVQKHIPMIDSGKQAKAEITPTQISTIQQDLMDLKKDDTDIDLSQLEADPKSQSRDIDIPQ